MSNPTRPGPAQPAPVTGPGPSSWPIPTIPGFSAPVVPGSASHSPATTTPTWKPNPPFGNYPAAGAAEQASNDRGQALIDSVKDRSNVDTTRRDGDVWPRKK